MGGSPIGEPASWYGPFVMNTGEGIIQAIKTHQAGRMGRIPAERQIAGGPSPLSQIRDSKPG